MKVLIARLCCYLYGQPYKATSSACVRGHDKTRRIIRRPVPYSCSLAVAFLSFVVGTGLGLGLAFVFAESPEWLLHLSFGGFRLFLDQRVSNEFPTSFLRLC